MDPAVSSLFPIHQIGADGFSWWVGQIESGKNMDPKKSGRYQVRIIGQHLKDGQSTPTSQLPWAQVMMPVTSPFSDGGKTGASVGLDTGNWVIGFFLDNDKQKPIIMGSIGHTAGATQRSNVEEDPNPGGTEKGFTTFLAESNPNLHAPLASKEKRNGDQPANSTTAETEGLTKPGDAGLPSAATPGQMPPAFYGLFAEASATNPTGSKVCVEIANPNCGSENDLKGGLTNIIGEMLKATQQSGGNVGSYYVSKINGEMNSYIDHGMQYVNKAVRLVQAFNGRVKGEIVKLIRDGVDQLVELLLYEKVVEETAEQSAQKAEQSEIDKAGEQEEPETKKQSRLKGVIDTVNDVLDDIGCEMADFTDRIASWLTDLLLGYLMDAFSNAACLVDNVVDGILNQILSFIEDFISAILGPLQQLFSALASPLDIIGNAINKVLSLLGITCDGPGAQCEKVTKECTDCSSGDTEDWLDKLIDQLEDGPLDGTTYVCDEAKNTSALESLPDTDIIFVGGTYPDPSDDPVPTSSNKITYTSEDIEVTEGMKAVFTITRGGNTTVSSSISVKIIGGTAEQDVDYSKIKVGSVIGFAPGEVEKELKFKTFKDNISEGPETFFIQIEEKVTPEEHFVNYPGGKVYKCTINNFNPGSTGISPGNPDDPSIPYVPPSTVNTESNELIPFINDIFPTNVDEVISVSSDKKFYKEGETITYTVSTENVDAGTVYTYTINGDVDEQDIEGGLTGSFEILLDGSATFTKTILSNDDTAQESISLFIDNTTAFTDAFILSDSDPDQTDIVWAVTSDVTYLTEGETVTFTISTLNVPDGTNFTYALEGNVTPVDIVGSRIVSSVDADAKPLQIVNNQCIIPITIASDGIDEETEYFDFVVKSYVDSNGDTQDIDDVDTRVSIIAPLGDTDVDVTPSYFVSADALTYKEGDTITYSITTTNVPDGTVLQYMLSGTSVSASDFTIGSLFDTFQVINNQATVYVGVEEDNEIENQETVTFNIVGTGASADVIIEADEEEDPLPDDPLPPQCYDKPVAGAPITDDNGSIISIPIIDKGCPYVFPPKVLITGPGYGASAIALTDSNGLVSEIRVTKTGVGYNVNPPGELRCVIDSYTIIKPGSGYTSPPAVYVDGVAGRAEAIIDERGYVISVRHTDRSTTYNEIPTIKFVGGGGSGARVVPSVVCLDNKEYEDQGYAKIGTGRYVDCP